MVSTMFLLNWKSTNGIGFYMLHTKFLVDRKAEVSTLIYATLTRGIQFWAGFDVRQRKNVEFCSIEQIVFEVLTDSPLEGQELKLQTVILPLWSS